MSGVFHHCLDELIRRGRIARYRALSDCRRVSGSPILRQPVLLLGEGSIAFGRDVELGWRTSMGFRGGYCQLEASKPRAAIEIGDFAQVNNGAFIKSEGPGIRIGARALLGSEVTIYDSDFHDLRPERRRDGQPRMGAVELEEDVFIGDRVLILKGARVGAHSVIGAGSVVTGSIPAGVIAAGNPARVIRELGAEQATTERSLRSATRASTAAQAQPRAAGSTAGAAYRAGQLTQPNESPQPIARSNGHAG